MLFKIMLLIHIFVLFFSQANTLNKYQINLEENDIEMNLSNSREYPPLLKWGINRHSEGL